MAINIIIIDEGRQLKIKFSPYQYEPERNFF